MKRLILLLSLTLFLSTSSGQVVLNEFMASNTSTVVSNSIAGEFHDWIELKNTSQAEVDLGGWHLSDDFSDLKRWSFPVGTKIPANGYLVVFASGENQTDGQGNLHTSFKLSKEAEFVGLSQPEGTLVTGFHPDGSPYPTQSEDISYGLHPSTGVATYFATPTPGSINLTTGTLQTSPLQVSPQRGYYQTAQVVTLSTPTPNATIYYTTDGTPPLNASGNPTVNSTLYSSPISLSQTSVIRAAAVAPGYSPSPTETHSYFLLDIDGASTNGSDPAGLNTPFLQQTQPQGWSNLASGDYNMDTSVTRSTAPSSGHPGLTVAQAMLQGMRDIPTISISLPKEDFAGPNGIYTNSEQGGVAWERACSAEFIPSRNDTRVDFQQDCGLRVQGGASRIPSRSPKHSLSFRFREQYGKGRLKEVLFPHSKVKNFNSIALRAGYNNSWIHSSASQRQAGSMIRDQWMRESLRDMGHDDAGDGFHVHVFINGLYFGVHNLAERQDNAHYAAYHDANSDLIDAVNGTTVVEGNTNSLNAMKSVVNTRQWEDIQQVLDVDTYIDFQILQRFGGNKDLKTNGNWRAAGGGPYTTPTDMLPWKIFSWDGERVLESPTETQVPLDPFNIRGILEAIPEYRRRFSDRAHLHLTGEGALTPQKCHERWVKYANTIDRAIIAESARWGDHRRSAEYTRNSEWLAEQNRLENAYFPVRTGNVTNNLIAANLFPNVELPEFNINGIASQGGYLPSPSSLSLTGPTGFIYYTLDGSDPANPDGSIRDSALEISSGTASEIIFPYESDGWRYLSGRTALSPSNIVVGHPSYNSLDWKHESFDDALWAAGEGLMAGQLINAISGKTAKTVLNIRDGDGGFPTVYFRKKFDLVDHQEITSLDVSVVRDDGFVLYLNGKEVFRDNMPGGTVSYETFALSGADELSFPSTTIPINPGDLREGENVIAIEVHNATAGSNDLGLDLTLSANRLVGAATVSLPNSALLTARSYVNTGGATYAWSAPIRGKFYLEPNASSANLAISEINYHPHEASLKDKKAATPLQVDNRDDFEFIELTNTSDQPLNLEGVTFSDGIEITLEARILNPGERVLLVSNKEVFLSRYGADIEAKIAGIYAGNLNNNGETITLRSSAGALIDSVTYQDEGSWPSRADGEGSTLERLNLSELSENSNNWISSISYGGSPATQGPLSDQRVVINEVLSNGTTDYIELHNTTDTPIDLTGWFLTDSKSVYQSFIFPQLTIGAHEYLTVDQQHYDPTPSRIIENYEGVAGSAPTQITSTNHGLETGDLVTISGYEGFSDFNGSFEVEVIDPHRFTIASNFLDNHSAKGLWVANRPFGLSAINGDDLWLLETDSEGRPTSFVDHVDFDGAMVGQPLGRWFDGRGNGTLYPMTMESKASTNAGPSLGPIYLTEIFSKTTTLDHQYIEITNQESTPIDLNHWVLRGSVDFDFGPAHLLGPDRSMILVSFDPLTETTKAEDFRTAFAINDEMILVGPFTGGPLSSVSGTLRIQKAGLPLADQRITVDEVRYQEGSPWPLINAENSLTRLPNLSFGPFSTSWTENEPTPGSFQRGDSYETWASVYQAGDPLEDSDRDQISNLMEFAMGTNPSHQNSLANLSFEEQIGILTYSQNPNANGVTLILEISPDLLNWNPVQTSKVGSNGTTDTYEFRFTKADQQKLHWRFKATSNVN